MPLIVQAFVILSLISVTSPFSLQLCHPSQPTMSLLQASTSITSRPGRTIPSYIDFNADKSFEGDMNAGLGTEKLLYEDADMLVYNKPTLAQTAPGFVSKDSLATRIQQQYNMERIDQMIVHRLDYATSGIVIFARTVDALRNLHTQFRNHHTMYKRYVAIVNGQLDCLEGEIDLRLGKDEIRGPPLQTVVSPDVEGKRSVTSYTVQAVGASSTLVHLIPKTGR